MRRIGVALWLIVAISVIVVGFTAWANWREEVLEELYRLSPQQYQSSSRIVFPKTTKGLWDFIHCAQDNWVYEEDYPGESCQRPAVSNRRWKGDCDDFAVMIAYYLQEYWGYDTYIIALDWTNDQGGHWVAFLHASESLKESMSKKCTGYYPYRISNNRIYIAIDWDLCPDWKWINEGPSNVKEWEWHELVERPI